MTSNATRLFTVAAAYYLFGRLGLALPYIGAHISLIWAPAGIALAAMLRWGPGMWPAVWLAAFAVNLSVGSTPLLAAGIACGNTLGPWLATRLLRRRGFSNEMECRRDLLAYLAIGAVGGMAVNAVNGVGNLYLAGLLTVDAIPTAGLVWWAGDAVGALIAGIPLLTLRRTALARAFSGWHGFGNLSLLLATLLVGVLVFQWPLGQYGNAGLAFLPLLTLIWLALRGGLFAASLANLLLAALAAWSLARGVGPLQAGTGHEALAMLWSYMAMLSIVTVLVTNLTNELRAGEERCRFALEGSGAEVWDWNLDGGVAFPTPGLDTPAAAGSPACRGNWRAWEARVHPDDLASVRATMRPILEAGTDAAEVEHRLRDGSGGWKWVLSRGRCVQRRSDGRPRRIIGISTDISSRRHAEDQARLAATVFNQSREVIIITDPEQRIVGVNKAFTEVTGYSEAEALGNTPSMLHSKRQSPAFYHDLWRILHSEGYWHGEIWNRRRNGEVYPVWLSISAVRDDKGKVLNYLSVSMDVSQHKAAEDRIRHLAYFDALTNLPNRLLLRDRVTQVLAHAHHGDVECAFLFIDLDDFKTINDSLGHLVGDHLLQALADRLRHAARIQDTVGRLGGDEFLVVLPGEGGGAAQVAETLLRDIAEPLLIDGHRLTVTASIGISLYPRDGADFDELLKHADAALYQAKAQRRNAYHFYTPEMNAAASERLMLENALRQALRLDEFEMHYQPQVRLDTGRIVSVEALLRWRHPELGLVPPNRFIPLAEENGLIGPIGEWVLRESCRQARRWQEQGLPPVVMAVNCSARQFGLGDMASLIRQVLEETGLEPEWLEIEITESLLASNLEATLATLREIRNLGVQLAVDDFGTGYSSLSYLKRFPLRKLKIDRSFVRDIMVDSDDRAISSAIINLGQSLGLTVVAEGVETGDQLEVLRQLGCHKVQGYLLGHPVPADEIAQRLADVAALADDGAAEATAPWRASGGV